MSRTIHISCDDCRATLWVGQYSQSNQAWRLYSSPEHHATLEAFVTTHIGHKIRFQDSEDVDIDYQDLSDYGED
jgi:hypothetical protein